MDPIIQTETLTNKEVALPTKPWYQSKTIWIGIILTAANIFEFLAKKYTGITIFGTVAGILVIVSRFSTVTAIQ